MDLQKDEQQHRLVAQQAEIELKRKELDLEYGFKQQQLNLEVELRRLAIERADENEKAARIHLDEVDKARLGMAHRGQTAAIFLAYPILLGSFLFGVVLIILTILGVIGAEVGGVLGGLFVGGPLLASTAKVIQSFVNSTTSGDQGGGSGDASSSESQSS